jgi:hypothetical protein
VGGATCSSVPWSTQRTLTNSEQVAPPTLSLPLKGGGDDPLSLTAPSAVISGEGVRW